MSKLILIVEDDSDVAMMMCEVLESQGYRAMAASNGREALDKLDEGIRPDVILLDMTMPVMDGWAFRAEQKSRPELETIPVVTVTADGNAKSKAKSIGATGYLAKPVSMDALLSEVERVCGSP